MLKKIIGYILPFSMVVSQSYTLNDCIIIALDNKRTLLASELGVLSAEKGVKGSYSGILPYIQASTSIGKTMFPEAETFDINFESFRIDTVQSNHFDNYSAGLSLVQTVYDGKRSWNQIQQAKTNLNIAKLNQRLIKTQVIQQVIQSYYQLLQSQKLLDVAKQNLEMSRQQVDLVKKQFDLGVVKKTDLLKAKVANGQARSDLLNRRTNYENSRRILFNDMGLRDFGQEIKVYEQPWIMPNIPTSSDILNQLKNNNPRLLISKAQIELNNLSYKLAKGLRRPTLNATMNYSANGESSNELIEALKNEWSLAFNVSFNIPIYEGSAISTQIQQSLLQKQQTEYSDITLLNDLRVQAELIRGTLNNYSEIIPINESVVSSAQEDLKLVRQRYSLGSATILEVLDAQVSLNRSNSTLINIIHDARMQEANLKALLGILDIEHKQSKK